MCRFASKCIACVGCGCHRGPRRSPRGVLCRSGDIASAAGAAAGITHPYTATHTHIHIRAHIHTNIPTRARRLTPIHTSTLFLTLYVSGRLCNNIRTFQPSLFVSSVSDLLLSTLLYCLCVCVCMCMCVYVCICLCVWRRVVPFDCVRWLGGHSDHGSVSAGR